MSSRTLQDRIRESDDVVGMLEANGSQYEDNFPVVPNEKTNWIDEQRAVMETCALGDLSHHMNALHAEGPDVVEFFSDLCVNSFEEFPVGKAKQVVMCGPDGNIMGDGPLLRLDDEEFWGVPICANWIRYNLETGAYLDDDYDVSVEFDPITTLQEGDPETFIYQVQGPNAFDVLDELTDDDFREIGFYEFERIDLAGYEVRAFGHGMNTESGFEFHGPFEYADEVMDAILGAGEKHGIRALGSKAYLSQSVRLGWVPPQCDPIYDGEELRGYREWLDADSREANLSIEGSFDSGDIRDYYISPVELGYENLISFDHDFVGREPLEAEVADPDRTLVSLRWDDDDVVDVYASLFGEGDNHRFMGLPRIQLAMTAFDRVLKDGETVGISHSRAYQWDVRGVVSLCRMDVAHSDPGTEVSVVWGEGSDTRNPKVEDHVPTEIAATVAPVPYTADRRKTTAD